MYDTIRRAHVTHALRKPLQQIGWSTYVPDKAEDANPSNIDETTWFRATSTLGYQQPSTVLVEEVVGKEDMARRKPKAGKAPDKRKKKGKRNANVGGDLTEKWKKGARITAKSSELVRRLELSTDGFWDFLFSDRWEETCLLRVLQGQLLDNLLAALYLLERDHDVISYVTIAYIDNPHPRIPCMKQDEADKERCSQFEHDVEEVFVELDYFCPERRPSAAADVNQSQSDPAPEQSLVDPGQDQSSGDPVDDEVIENPAQVPFDYAKVKVMVDRPSADWVGLDQGSTCDDTSTTTATTGLSLPKIKCNVRGIKRPPPHEEEYTSFHMLREPLLVRRRRDLDAFPPIELPPLPIPKDAKLFEALTKPVDSKGGAEDSYLGPRDDEDADLVADDPVLEALPPLGDSASNVTAKQGPKDAGKGKDEKDAGKGKGKGKDKKQADEDDDDEEEDVEIKTNLDPVRERLLEKDLASMATELRVTKPSVKNKLSTRAKLKRLLRRKLRASARGRDGGSSPVGTSGSESESEAFEKTSIPSDVSLDLKCARMKRWERCPTFAEFYDYLVEELAKNPPPKAGGKGKAQQGTWLDVLFGPAPLVDLGMLGKTGARQSKAAAGKAGKDSGAEAGKGPKDGKGGKQAGAGGEKGGEGRRGSKERGGDTSSRKQSKDTDSEKKSKKKDAISEESGDDSEHKKKKKGATKSEGSAGSAASKASPKRKGQDADESSGKHSGSEKHGKKKQKQSDESPDRAQSRKGKGEKGKGAESDDREGGTGRQGKEGGFPGPLEILVKRKLPDGKTFVDPEEIERRAALAVTYSGTKVLTKEQLQLVNEAGLVLSVEDPWHICVRFAYEAGGLCDSIGVRNALLSRRERIYQMIDDGKLILKLNQARLWSMTRPVPAGKDGSPEFRLPDIGIKSSIGEKIGEAGSSPRSPRDKGTRDPTKKGAGGSSKSGAGKGKKDDKDKQKMKSDGAAKQGADAKAKKDNEKKEKERKEKERKEQEKKEKEKKEAEKRAKEKKEQEKKEKEKKEQEKREKEAKEREKREKDKKKDAGIGGDKKPGDDKKQRGEGAAADQGKDNAGPSPVFDSDIPDDISEEDLFRLMGFFDIFDPKKLKSSYSFEKMFAHRPKAIQNYEALLKKYQKPYAGKKKPAPAKPAKASTPPKQKTPPAKSGTSDTIQEEKEGEEVKVVEAPVEPPAEPPFILGKLREFEFLKHRDHVPAPVAGLCDAVRNEMSVEELRDRLVQAMKLFVIRKERATTTWQFQSRVSVTFTRRQVANERGLFMADARRVVAGVCRTLREGGPHKAGLVPC